MQQHLSASPESPAPPPNMPCDINDTPFKPFEEFKAEVDSLVADIMQHPQRDQLLSDFRQMLREMGIPIEDPVDAYDHYSDGYFETSFQADANGPLTGIDFESGQMAITSSSTHGMPQGATNEGF